jgi:hypothetical protein
VSIAALGLGAIALVASPAAFAQGSAVTAPVGYRTESILTGQFNLLSPNLSNAVSAAGAFDAAATTTLTDNEADYTTSLADANATYVLKITSGAGAGQIVEIASVTNATTLVTAEDISAIANGASYEIRAAVTVTQAFGAANATTLATGNADTADIIWIPAGGGAFERVYSDGTNYRKVGNLFGTFPNEPIVFTDAVFVQRRGATNLDVVFTGHVETTKTTVALATGFNYVSRVLPVGVSLADSGLAAGLAAGTADTADIVWVPDPATPGAYIRYYVDGTAMWRKVGNLFGTFPNDLLQSGMILQNRGAAKSVTLEIPASLDI